MPHTSVKGQVLADLVVEFAETPLDERIEKQNMDGKSVGAISSQEPLSWKVYIDGAVNHRGSGVGLVLTSPERITIEKSLRLGFSATNNEAEYEVLLVGMTMVQKMGGKVVEIFYNSRLVVGQVQGELEARYLRMQGYLNQGRHLQSRFKSFNLPQIPISRNIYADFLVTLATSSEMGDGIQVHQIRVGSSWMDSIVLFLKEDVLPEGKSKADKVQRKAP